MQALPSFAKLAVLALAFLWAGCADPVRTSAIEALGPETAVPVGPLHRPGQPCGVCHADDGNAGPFSVSGTVYLTKGSTKPAARVEILLFDAANRSHRVRTNCAGNFYVRPGELRPVYPLWVTLRHGTHRTEMESPMFREGSCAACHSESAGPRSAGPVFLAEDEIAARELAPASCGSAP
jgi:mono/diheme cytochrome c family protein